MDHVRFGFLEKVYTYELLRAQHVTSDNEKIAHYRAYVMRGYLLYLVGTGIFVDKRATYMDVIYMRYFDVFE